MINAAHGATRAACILLGLGILGAAPATAQSTADDNFPSRAIRIVVPASPGGVNDILARLVGQKMSESFGQPVVIENKPGAATILGAETVARSAPDGYTMLIAPTATMAINPAVYSKLSYEPLKDFIPLSAVATYPYVLTASGKAAASSVQDLIDFAKANPDKANAGGASMTFQLLTEMFKAKTGTSIQYIPYKGANDANLALIAGQLTISFLDTGPAMANIKAGNIKALAVTSPKRLASLPDVPTMAEAGLKDMTVESWAGLFLTAGTPAPIVQKLQDEIRRIVQLPDFQQTLRAQELTPVGNTSKEFEAMLVKDTEMWADVARAANVKIN